MVWFNSYLLGDHESYSGAIVEVACQDGCSQVKLIHTTKKSAADKNVKKHKTVK
jgi:hypothetical protein